MKRILTLLFALWAVIGYSQTLYLSQNSCIKFQRTIDYEYYQIYMGDKYIQYIYRRHPTKPTRKLVTIVDDYAKESTPTHKFLITRNKVFTHFGYKLD